MRKELNPSLFANEGVDFIDSRSISSNELASLDIQSLNPTAETKRLEKRIESLATETKSFKSDLVKTIQTRIEMFVQKLNGVDAKVDALAQDLRSKYSNLSGKVTEHNLSDMKTQALIDRHTHLLRQFEQRVASLQRVIEEQEYQILNHKAALDEARREIARLKRV